jgi:tetratricopeptide (TPR) repeat protein
MQLLVTLSRRAGKLVTRAQVFDSCWGSAAVGDDSLNRVVAVLRKALRQTAAGAVRIETVPGSGYVLRLAAVHTGEEHATDDVLIRDAIEAGFDSWRVGLPEPDHLRLELLRRATAEHPENSDAWGMLALLCRQATEYAEPADVPAFVAECQAAARRALSINDGQAEALAALASVAPIYGRWGDARAALTRAFERAPDHMVVLHDLAIVEMATGRVCAAKSIMDGLIARDPLAACFCYKSIYQHWSVGDLTGLDDVGDRAIQLWPNHPAVWMARFWTLAHTGRARAALAMIEDVPARPRIPGPMLDLLRLITTAAGHQTDSRLAIDACKKAAERGPAQAVAAILGLGLFDAVNEAFDVALAYYLRAGDAPVPVRHMTSDASINDQHRRVTQPLFTPACAGLRADKRFLELCERMGLTRYWDSVGLCPDFRSTG